MSYLEEYVPPSRRGVVHFTSIPRDMRPPEVCLHFNQFGTITRHRFVPYPKKERRPGGPLLPLQYKEGWVEFSKAEDARTAAAYLNNQPVNCKRGRRCFGQLWTVKFLKNFTWDSLLEEREGERRARRAAEVEARRQERDANEAYRRLVMQGQQQRAVRRRQREGSSPVSTEGGGVGPVAEGKGEPGDRAAGKAPARKQAKKEVAEAARAKDSTTPRPRKKKTIVRED